jgi:hypothetical protein
MPPVRLVVCPLDMANRIHATDYARERRAATMAWDDTAANRLRGGDLFGFSIREGAADNRAVHVYTVVDQGRARTEAWRNHGYIDGADYDTSGRTRFTLSHTFRRVPWARLKAAAGYPANFKLRGTSAVRLTGAVDTLLAGAPTRTHRLRTLADMWQQPQSLSTSMAMPLSTPLSTSLSTSMAALHPAGGGRGTPAGSVDFCAVPKCEQAV